MTNMVETRRLDREPAVAPPGLANPVFVGLSIVATLAAAVLAARSVMAGDHRAHVWNVRLFGFVIVCVTLLAILRIGARVMSRLRATRPVVLVAPLAELDRGSGHDARGARRHRRVVPTFRSTTLRTYDGRKIEAHIVDVSMRGVAVEAPISDVEFATVIRVGSRAAGPIRRVEKVAVFRFEHLLDPLECNGSLIL